MSSTIEILTAVDYDRIASVVHAHCGINLHEGKRELVQARLAKLLRLTHYQSAREYLDHVLEAGPDDPAFVEFIDSLSTNLTSFFRESDHFDFLADEFLPALFAARGAGPGRRRIRAWSAACSTGEEPYSLAMTLQNALEDQPDSWQASILATDISTRVLRTARLGMYEPHRAEAVPQNLRLKYLAKNPARRECPAHVQVVPAIRSMVHFAHMNLLQPWPFQGPLDFIFCRNVMIYFDKPTQQDLVNRMWDILEPGGVLFTGHSESLTGIAHRFSYVRPTIYRKP